MSTQTKSPEGHEGLWGRDMEPQSVRDAYDAELAAQGVHVVPAPRQSTEGGGRG